MDQSKYIIVFDSRAGWALAHWWTQSRAPNAVFQADATATFQIVGEWTHDSARIEREADRLNGRAQATA